MKKICSILLILAISISMFAGCGSPAASIETESSSDKSQGSQESVSSETLESHEETSDIIEDNSSDDITIQIGAMKGPTSMGMVKLMDDAEKDMTKNNYTFTLGSIDDMVANLAKGEFDIAAVPANLSSVLYNNTEGQIQVLAVNTLGVLYVVDQSGTIGTVADLKGKTLYSTGKGATPEYSINYVLEKNGINPQTDINIEFKSEAAEIIPLLMNNPEAVALLPQPFVTVAQQKVEGLDIALDWAKEWDAVAQGESSMITGVIVVQKDFAEEYPELLEQFKMEYQASTQFTGTNLEQASELIGKYGIVDAEIAKIALPACNIVYIDGMEMKQAVAGYLSVLHDQNPKSIGGSLPDEGFYHIEKE